MCRRIVRNTMYVCLYSCYAMLVDEIEMFWVRAGLMPIYPFRSIGHARLADKIMIKNIIYYSLKTATLRIRISKTFFNFDHLHRKGLLIFII